MSSKFVSIFLLLILHLQQCQSMECEITYKITEEVPIDTLVGDLSKHLTKNEEGSKFVFFTDDNEYIKFFRIEEQSNKLFTVKRIDREEWCETADIDCELDMKLVMQTSTNDYLGTCELYISVIDINDNPPVFENAVISIEIVESSPIDQVIYVKSAHDPDTGNNTVKSYELLNGQDKFALKIDENGFLIGLILKTELDREKEDFYNLTLIAKDGGIPQQQGSVIINLKVKDINDNIPKFTQESYNIDVFENASISSKILTLSARDADSGENGQVSYEFFYNVPKSVKRIFSIDETSGDIILKKEIDFEKKYKEYSFKVVALDNGSPSKSSDVSVNINVLNINDNKPDIFILHVSDNVSESDEIGHTIARISVSDKDDDQKNAVVCSLSDPHFKLDSDQHQIMIDKQLDYEETQTYNVSILCRDHGEPPLENQISFLVNVNDENDNEPVFKNPIIKSQRENAGFQAFNVVAEDLDSGMNSMITYELLNDSISYLFNISDVSGLITTDVQFDREKNPELEIRVLAIDMGKPPLTGTGTVILRILDVNDEVPYFEKDHYEFHVNEQQAPSTFIGKVEAYDLDIGENGELSYWIIADNSSDYFEIDQGNLTTDTTLTYSRNLNYEFTIFARDNGTPSLTTWTNVTIFVDDVNDNSPYFLYPTSKNNSISIIYKMTATNRPIATVIAIDEDDGENAKLSYFLEKSSESSKLFRIDNSTGEIKLVKDARGKRQEERIKLTIIARDHGAPYRESSSNLFVAVDFGNHTWPSNIETENPSDELDRKIGIILGIVTVCLILIMIVVICIVRRIDENRRHYHARKVDHVSQARTQCSLVSLNHEKTLETTDACSLQIRDRMESDLSEYIIEEEEIDESSNINEEEKLKDISRQNSLQDGKNGGSCAALL